MSAPRIARARLILSSTTSTDADRETARLVLSHYTEPSTKAAVAADAPDARLRRQREKQLQDALVTYFDGFLKRVRKNV